MGIFSFNSPYLFSNLSFRLFRNTTGINNYQIRICDTFGTLDTFDTSSYLFSQYPAFRLVDPTSKSNYPKSFYFFNFHGYYYIENLIILYQSK